MTIRPVEFLGFVIFSVCFSIFLFLKNLVLLFSFSLVLLFSLSLFFFSVSSTVAGGGGAHKGYGSTAAKQRQLMERKTTGSARRVQESDERWPAITSGHVAKKTCRAIGMETLTTKDIPTGDADSLSDRFGELVESHESFKFQVLKNPGWLAGMTEDDVLKRVNVGVEGGATGAAQGASAIVLASPGLSVIVEAIDLARKIFPRMKNYRIACAMQLLVFFCVDPQAAMGSEGSTKDTADHGDKPRYFARPVIVLITILNIIAYDCVEAGKVPEKGILYIVCGTAALLGGVACSSILMLHMCPYANHEESIPRKHFGVPQLSYMQIQCALYLKVSHFLTVFTHGFFFSRHPGVLPACAAVRATNGSIVEAGKVPENWPIVRSIAALMGAPSTLMLYMWSPHQPRGTHLPKTCPRASTDPIRSLPEGVHLSVRRKNP